MELDGVAGADGEVAPVDDGALGGLGDVGAQIGLQHRGGTADDDAIGRALGPGQRGPGSQTSKGSETCSATRKAIQRTAEGPHHRRALATAGRDLSDRDPTTQPVTPDQPVDAVHRAVAVHMCPVSR